MGVMKSMEQRHKTKTSPAQRDSGNSILAGNAMGRMRIMGSMRQRHKSKNSPAQRDGRLSGVLCWPHGQNRPTQQDSGISIFRMGEHVHTESAKHTKDGIFTMRIRNIDGCFTGKRVDGAMSKMQNCPAQRYSKMSNLKIKTENSFPQRHSKMSNGRLSGVLCWPHGQNEMSTARIKNIVDAIRVMGQKHKTKNSPVQRDSGMSNLAVRLTSQLAVRLVPQSGDPTSPTERQRAPAQRDSKMSNGRLSGVSCWPHGGRLSEISPARRDSGIYKLGNGAYRSYGTYGTHGPKTCNENRPAQRDSEISILADGTMGLMGVMRVMRLMGGKPEKQNRSAQRDSGNSILKTCPYRPYCPYRPLDFKNRSAQPGSKNSNLVLSLCLCVSVVKAVQQDSGINKLRGIFPVSSKIRCTGF